MARTLKEIIDKLLPIYREDADKFMRFYNKVYSLLSNLKQGDCIRISDCCTSRSMELFIDVAEFCIIEELKLRKLYDDHVEFTDDRAFIRRTFSCKPHKEFKHFYSKN